MEYDQEHVYQLLLSKKKGNIGGADDEYIRQLMVNNEDVYLLWEDIRRNNFDEDAWYEIDNPAAAWEQVHRQITAPHTYQRQPAIRTWLTAACIAAAVAVGAWFLLRPSATVTDPALVAREPKGLRLELANGKAIVLPYQQSAQQIDVADVKLQAGGNSLQYAAGANSDGGLNTLVVPPKMDYRIVLSDGTEVWLNATSTLRFPFTFKDSRREVYLEGEGYFKVAKNDRQPFIVHTPKTDVEVLGTEFNVNTYHQAFTSTSLVSGTVVARAGGSKVVLKPGQEAVFTDAAGFTVRPCDTADVRGWINGVFLFNNTPLQDITPAIERWFGVRTVFDSPALRTLPFTGAMDKQHDLLFFLQNLKATGMVDFYFEGEMLHLTELKGE